MLVNPTDRYQMKEDRFSSHAQIARRLQSDRSQRKPDSEYAVLDVGCARGFLAAWLSAPDFYLMGVDNDQGALNKIGDRYQQKIWADIESLAQLSLDRDPDAMVLADVLEHCRDAASVLTALCRQQLRPGTPVIISLPNVAHLYTRLSLLLGRFNYAERGILDRTHVHFYTLKTARLLCAQSAISIERVTATPVPLPLINPRFSEGRSLFWMHRATAAAARIHKNLFAYQFLLYGTYQP